MDMKPAVRAEGRRGRSRCCKRTEGARQRESATFDGDQGSGTKGLRNVEKLEKDDGSAQGKSDPPEADLPTLQKTLNDGSWENAAGRVHPAERSRGAERGQTKVYRH